MRRLVSVGTLTSSNVLEVVNEGAVFKYVPWILDEDENVSVYARPSIASRCRRCAHAGDVESVKPMSLVVVADADSDRGARVIAEVAKHVASSGGSMSRFTVAHVATPATMGKRSRRRAPFARRSIERRFCRSFESCSMSSRSVPIPRTSRRALDCSRRSSRDRWRTTNSLRRLASRVDDSRALRFEVKVLHRRGRAGA